MDEDDLCAYVFFGGLALLGIICGINDLVTNKQISENFPKTSTTIYAWEMNRNGESFLGINLLNKCNADKKETICINSFNEENEDDKNMNVISDSINNRIDYEKNELLNMLNDRVPLKDDLQLLPDEKKDENHTTESILTNETVKKSSKKILNGDSDNVQVVKKVSDKLFRFKEVDKSKRKIFKTTNSDVNPKCNYEQTKNYALPGQVLNNLFVKNKIGSFDCVKCKKGVENMEVLVLEESEITRYRNCRNLRYEHRPSCEENPTWTEKTRKGCYAECSCPRENII